MSFSLRSLEKVKSLKERLTQQAWLSYESALTEQREAEDLLAAMEAEIAQAEEQWKQSQLSTRLSVQELSGWHQLVTALKEQAQKQFETAARTREACRSRQADLTGCYQDEQIWSQLSETRQAELEALGKKTEQALLDEVATNRYSRE